MGIFKLLPFYLFQNGTSVVSKREKYLNISGDLWRMHIKNILGSGLVAAVFFYSHSSQSQLQDPSSLEHHLRTPEQEFLVCEQPLEERLDIEEDVEALNHLHNYGLHGEDLVFLTRVVYFESAHDRKAKTEEDLVYGQEAVARVILNRYLFDKEHGITLFGKKHTLRDIVTKKFAFSPTHLKRKFFTPSSLYDGNGELSLGYSTMNLKETKAIYDILVKVLRQDEDDLTSGSLFFKADYVRQKWDGKRAFFVGEKPCHFHLELQLNTHEFYNLDCSS